MTHKFHPDILHFLGGGNQPKCRTELRSLWLGAGVLKADVTQPASRRGSKPQNLPVPPLSSGGRRHIWKSGLPLDDNEILPRIIGAEDLLLKGLVPYNSFYFKLIFIWFQAAQDAWTQGGVAYHSNCWLFSGSYFSPLQWLPSLWRDWLLKVQGIWLTKLLIPGKLDFEEISWISGEK